MVARELLYGDLERAARLRDPNFAALVIRYLEQPDPPPGEPEERDDGVPFVVKDDWTLPRLLRAVAPTVLENRSATERKSARREAWESLLASEYFPPRLKLGALLVDLYQAGDEPAVSALLEIFQRARIALGMWRGMKRIYKLAELRHDAAMFGVLAYRFDVLQASAYDRSGTNGEVSTATFTYLATRAWRYLRQLGRAVPELYPIFAAQVLKNYPADFRFYGSRVGKQIFEHKAFVEMWKLSADPLLRLLEDAKHDEVADFAVRTLKKEHPEALRSADPRWIARLGSSSVGAIHALVIELLQGTPELHGSKLRALGLHEMVLSLLKSNNAAARKYAIDYASTYAPDISVEVLVQAALSGANEVRVFAAAKLSQKPAAEIGLESLIRLLESKEAATWAMTKIREHYRPGDVSLELFQSLFMAGPRQRKFIVEFFAAAKIRPPPAYYLAVAGAPNADHSTTGDAWRALSAYSGREIGQGTIEKALFDPRLSDWVMPLIRGGILAGEELRVEWVQSLLERPRFRPLALELLANTKLIAPARLSVSWLLEQSKSADETITNFAHQYLLAHFPPAAIGVPKLWSLARDTSEPLRRFAANYLLSHHPELHSRQQSAVSLGLKPALTAQDYAQSFVEPLFLDERPDVRRLAAAIAKEEMLRWNDPALLFRLANSVHRELRTAAGELLLSIGEADADPARAPPVEWLGADTVFALAESLEKTAREVALALIRRHYDRLGGKSRLAWLMESPDREVRLFAVRLLFEKHRRDRYRADDELLQFLRSTLLGLPPGRMERRELSAEILPGRALSASVAKRRLIEVVRDLAVEDLEFARLIEPVLVELSGSVAKGEWQSCVAALAWIARAHPDLKTREGTTA